MGAARSISVLTGLIVLFAACPPAPDDASVANSAMTEEQRDAVTHAILEVTSEWAEANRRRDANAVSGLFDDTDEFRHVENGVIFSSHKAVSDFVTRWYETTAEMDHAWEERTVFPLSPDAAIMTGIFRYEARQQSGEVWSGRNVFTAVFIRRGHNWKVIQGHESSVPSSQPQ